MAVTQLSFSIAVSLAKLLSHTISPFGATLDNLLRRASFDWTCVFNDEEGQTTLTVSMGVMKDILKTRAKSEANLGVLLTTSVGTQHAKLSSVVAVQQFRR